MRPSRASLVALRSTSQRLLRLADSDSVWVPLLQALWEGKVYVPLWLREWRADPAIDARRAYILSLQDARRAQYTSGEELCSLVFEFCFKEEAADLDRAPEGHQKAVGGPRGEFWSNILQVELRQNAN